MSTEQTTTCTKKRILYDVVVEADLSRMIFPSRHYKSEEERAKHLEEAAKEFHSFLRDHRSQDMVTLYVERKYKDVCSACATEWEPDTIDGVPSCANCGAIIESKQ